MNALKKYLPSAAVAGVFLGVTASLFKRKPETPVIVQRRRFCLLTAAPDMCASVQRLQQLLAIEPQPTDELMLLQICDTANKLAGLKFVSDCGFLDFEAARLLNELHKATAVLLRRPFRIAQVGADCAACVEQLSLEAARVRATVKQINSLRRMTDH